MQYPVTHYYPDARVIIVKGFGDDVKVTSDRVIQLDLKSVIRVHTLRTIRNSPGTFSLTLFDTNNQLLTVDDPEQVIPVMYEQAQNQKAIDRQGVGKSTQLKGISNYYDFENYTAWKNFTHIVLEEEDGSARYIAYYARNGAGDIIARWAINAYGEVIWLMRLPESELRDPNNNGKVLVLPTGGNKLTSGKNKPYILHQYRNEEFLSRYSPRLDHGHCKIEPMDRVVIFYSKRFVRVGGNWKIQTGTATELIRSFTGLVSKVGVEYQENRAQITIEGEDVTKWMKLTLTNVNPAGLAHLRRNKNPQDVDSVTGGVLPPIMMTERFAKMSVPDVVKFLLLGYRGLDKNSSKGESVRGHEQGIGSYKLATVGKPVEWVYDIGTGQYKETHTKLKASSASYKEILGTLFTSSSVHVIDATKFGLRVYEPYLVDTSGVEKWQGEFKDRRQIVYELAQEINYFFYADRNGEVWFTPPRMSNAWLLGAENPRLSILDEQSIISYSLVESDEQIATNIVATTVGDMATVIAEALQVTGQYMATYQDDGLVMKYGVRYLLVHNPLIRNKNTEFLYFYAKQVMTRLLHERLQGSITITGRSEIQEGYPVYIPFVNMIYLAETVEDSMEVNGQYTTTISLSNGHKPWDFVPEFLTYGNDSVGAWSDLSRIGFGSNTPEKKRKTDIAKRMRNFETEKKTTRRPSRLPEIDIEDIHFLGEVRRQEEQDSIDAATLRSNTYEAEYKKLKELMPNDTTTAAARAGEVADLAVKVNFPEQYEKRRRKLAKYPGGLPQETPVPIPWKITKPGWKL